MQKHAESAGIMSGAFFVGRGELLKWLNDFFEAGYNKIEQVATGAIHCQIMDSIFPGKVPLHRVNFEAKFDYEYVNNYKVLQRIFQREQIQKHIDVDKLIKGKYQDNLEFLQWMKNFWDSRYGGDDYDALGRREEAMARYKSGKKTRAANARSGVKPRPTSSKPAASRAPRAASKPSSTGARKPAPRSGASGAASNAKVAELTEKVSKLRSTIEALEKERNFYFGKLREIEILVQENEEEDAGTKAKVLEILYATDDNNEFEAAEDAVVSEDVAAVEDDLDFPDEDAEVIGDEEEQTF